VEEVTDVNEFSQDVDDLSKTEESSQRLYQPQPDMLYGQHEGQQYAAGQGGSGPHQDNSQPLGTSGSHTEDAYLFNNMNNQPMHQQQRLYNQ